MKKNRHPLMKSALILTLAGLVSRVIGFFYKIFLASLIGAEGIGIYQMIFPTYMLCVSLASSGIQTAISRFTAEKLSTGQSREARNLFYTGLAMAVSLAGVLAFLLFFLSEPMAVYLLKEPRCFPLLQLMAFSIPFEVLHTCANGYFLGQKKAAFPAVSQLLEQIIRVGATFLLYQIMVEKGMAPSPILAVGGMLAAEVIAALITITVLAFMKTPDTGKNRASALFSKSSPQFQTISAITSVAFPITCNRLLINVLQSVEAAMIPLRLQMYYGNSSAALSTYGIFTGMAMPLIMFPNAVTGSFSMVLLPSVSEAHALKNDKKIAATIQSSLLLCLSLGITCTAAFLLFGSSMGQLLYHNDRVGDYLATLSWICPFLYLTTTNSSILHGLGKTMDVFLHNLAGLLLRLLFTFFLVPVFGVQACLWGLLASQLLTALLGIMALKRTVNFTLSPAEGILMPAGCCLASTSFLQILRYLLPILNRTDQWIPFLLSAGLWSGMVVLLFGFFLPPVHKKAHEKTKHREDEAISSGRYTV